jgi:hypothetical protein
LPRYRINALLRRFKEFSELFVRHIFSLPRASSTGPPFAWHSSLTTRVTLLVKSFSNS